MCSDDGEILGSPGKAAGDHGGEREELRAAVEARLRRVESLRDMTLALEPGVIEEAQLLAAILRGGDDDLGADDLGADDLMARNSLGWLAVLVPLACPARWAGRTGGSGGSYRHASSVFPGL
jgi:hypothetical protein